MAGTVGRIGVIVKEGASVFHFTLVNHPGRIFWVTGDTNPGVALTHPGDTVDLESLPGQDGGLTEVRRFSNGSLNRAQERD